MLGTLTPMIRSALACSALSLSQLAAAQTTPGTPVVKSRAICNSHGSNATERLGDGERHLQVGDGTCAIQGGPLDGAVLTQQTLWVYDKGVGTMLSSHGVYRKAGGFAAYVNTAGTVTLQSAEGRVTGWASSGKGRVAMASGSLESAACKSYSWAARPTGPRSYVIESDWD